VLTGWGREREPRPDLVGIRRSEDRSEERCRNEQADDHEPDHACSVMD